MFCPHCGKEITEDQDFCHHCGSRARENAPEPIAAAGERVKTPWEDRETTGFFGGLSLTVRQVISSPTAFFRKMPVTGGLTAPLLFALIIGMIGLMFSYLWDILLHNSMQSLMTEEMREVVGTMSGGIGSSFATIMMPFMFILWLFIVSGMLHVFLLMAHGARNGFEATFRVAGYSVTPFLFLAVPYCGTAITLLWVMTLSIIGLKEAHETTGGKSAFAVLFPFLFCCGLLIFTLVLFMGVIAASFGSLMNLQK